MFSQLSFGRFFTGRFTLGPKTITWKHDAIVRPVSAAYPLGATVVATGFPHAAMQVRLNLAFGHDLPPPLPCVGSTLQRNLM
ncbi:MAG: hypothetical protein JSR30_02880 [Proteobacteria bacterium]|nr:hypothetical protein [Pseudomonadota bacterium]